MIHLCDVVLIFYAFLPPLRFLDLRFLIGLILLIIRLIFLVLLLPLLGALRSRVWTAKSVQERDKINEEN